jgi:hypothetical protein
MSMLRDKMKSAELKRGNSIVDKPSTPVSFFQKIFCMPLPSKEEE